MSQPPFSVRVSITVQFCDHPHNLSLDQRFWSSPVYWRQMVKQHTIGNQQNLIIPFVVESPYEVIETGSSASKSSIFLQLVSKIKSGVVCAPASNFPYELDNTISRDAMSIGSSWIWPSAWKQSRMYSTSISSLVYRSTRSGCLPALASEFLLLNSSCANQMRHLLCP